MGAHEVRSHQVVKDLHNGSIELDDDARQDLIKTTRVKLQEYHEFVNGYSELRKQPDAPSNSIANVQKWLKAHSGAIDPKEVNFVDGHGDIIPIASTARSLLRRVLEKLEFFRSRTMSRRTVRRTNPSLSDQFNLGTTIYHSDERIDNFVNAIICVIRFVMLAAPLWILFYVPSRQNQLIVITVFVAAFLAVVQSVSLARPFESLAATAAYSAVLMVFMQIGPQNGAYSIQGPAQG